VKRWFMLLVVSGLTWAAPASAWQRIEGNFIRVDYANWGVWNHRPNARGLQFRDGTEAPWVDYTWPGTPWQVMTVEYNVGATAHYYRANTDTNSFTVTAEANRSHDTWNISYYQYTAGTLRIGKWEYWQDDGRVMWIEFEVTNTGASDVTSFRIMHGLDPDPGTPLGAGATTYNDVLDTNADGIADWVESEESSARHYAIGYGSCDTTDEFGHTGWSEDADAVFQDQNGGFRDDTQHWRHRVATIRVGASVRFGFIVTFGGGPARGDGAREARDLYTAARATLCGGCDTDSDGFVDVACGGNDCDDSNAAINIDAAEICDGVNNDCDATTADGADEEWLGDACDGDDSDLCNEGVLACTAGARACTDVSGDTLDLCNGRDEDCNPATADGSDEEWLGDDCDGDDSDLCAEGEAVCSAGARACTDDTGDTLDLCNGADDDCNAATADGADEEWLGDACDGDDTDLCTEGVEVCVDGDRACTDDTDDVLDLCNGLDDDCNVVTADGADEVWLGDACDGADSDLCSEGVEVCSAGARACTDDTGDTLDLCNGADDDCNAATADGSGEEWLGEACDGDDSDLCDEGVEECSAGRRTCTDDTGDTAEECNGEDDDCDGVVPDDELDTDGDGFRGCGGDCDDTDSTVFPGAVELCNAIDDDCDSVTEDGSGEEWLGTECDGDDLDLCEEGVFECTDGEQVCADLTADTPEECNGEDDDCDGEVPDDELDADGDGQMACEGDCDDSDPTVGDGFPELCDGIDNDCDGDIAGENEDTDDDGQTPCDGDCNDLNPDTFAGADETCDGEDNDCDGVIPDDELDADEDGQMACEGDCDDSDPTVGDGFPELCDGIDNDCDGDIAGETEDADGDGQTPCEGDCDDGNADTFDGAEETCDGEDNDCDGEVPEDESDADGDEHLACDDDCDDSDAETYTGAEETCDGADNDCDGETPDDELDQDGDGQAPCDGDCDDANADTYTGAPEIDDGLDNDCDGTVPAGEQDDGGGCNCRTAGQLPSGWTFWQLLFSLVLSLFV